MKISSNLTKSIAALAIIAGTLSPQLAFADNKVVNEHAKGNMLVALGDSISFGLNLGDNTHASNLAFPYLVADADNFHLANLAVSGDTTVKLLQRLQDETYRENIRHAKQITLEIGSNDLLLNTDVQQLLKNLVSNPSYQPTATDFKLVGSLSKQMGVNLAAIIQEIRTLTDAPIVMYNIYNPYFGKDQQAGLLLAGANSIIGNYNGRDNITVVDALNAFAGKQNVLVRDKDVHPTAQGQEVLAQLAENVIK
jgi:lysophospholipase L1-like esterase